MIETSQQTYLIAAAVVGLGLTILGFIVWEGMSTSKLYRQGVALYQDKNYQAAEVAFRQVVSRHPSNDMVRLLLGDVLVQQNKLEEAINQFRELINRTSKNGDAYLRLGIALVKQDKLEDAITAIEKARDLFKAQRNPQKADQIAQLLQQMNESRSGGGTA